MREDGLRFPRPGWPDDVYWLRHCEGFRVESPARDVGVVSELRYSSQGDWPDKLVLRSGRFGRHRLLVPVELIREIHGKEKTIVPWLNPGTCSDSEMVT